MPVERLLEAEIAVDPASFPSNHTSGGGPSGSGFLSGQSHGVNAGDQVCLTFPACVVQKSTVTSHHSRGAQTPNRMELWRYADNIVPQLYLILSLRTWTCFIMTFTTV